jgi:alpha-glucuronidase
VHPWEDASRGKAVSCPAAADRSDQRPCSAEWVYAGRTGTFDLAVQYFDLQDGAAKFLVKINGTRAGPDASWIADAHLPTRHLHGDNSVRHTLARVVLKPGDTIRIEGTPDGNDPAAIDYIELTAVAAP